MLQRGKEMSYSNPQGPVQEKVLRKAPEFPPGHLLCFQHRRAGRWPGSLRNANAIQGEQRGSDRRNAGSRGTSTTALWMHGILGLVVHSGRPP